MRVSVRLRRAVAKFFFLTNKRPEPDALHRSLHTLLADANPEPLSHVDRLSSRLQRKNNLTSGDAKRQAEILARVVTRNASELPTGTRVNLTWKVVLPAETLEGRGVQRPARWRGGGRGGE